MIHTKIRTGAGTAAIAVALALAVATPAGAAPAPSTADAQVAVSAGGQVDAADLVTQQQAQRAANASSWGDRGYRAEREEPTAASAESGSPFHLDMLRDGATASAAVRYRASGSGDTTDGRPVGSIVEQRSFVYPNAAGASTALTRHLDYLEGLQPSPEWAEVFGLRATRVTGVANDAYWRDLSVPAGIESNLVFRQGNIVTLLTTSEYEIDTSQENRAWTVRLGTALAAAQRPGHSTSPATPAVVRLGSHPLEAGDI